MGPKLRFRLRRAAPVVALVLAFGVGGVSVWQAARIVQYLRAEARDQTRVFSSVVGVMQDTLPQLRMDDLIEVVRQILATGIPLIVMDGAGAVTVCANLPLDPDPCDLSRPALTDPRITVFARELAQTNQPVVNADGSRIFFGATDAARRLTYLTLLQLLMLGVAITGGVWGFRAAAHRHRDQLWVAMARESAHQLGTPLMSAAAWIERLRDRAPDTQLVAKHLKADLDRLERVAQRFERIGRPARQDRVGVGALAARVANYFAARLPRHANQIELRVDAPAAGPMVSGDAVLLEWAVEALVRNAIDALSGRGGRIDVAVHRKGERVVLIVEDDGPGVGIDVRDTLFQPGVTTKSGGWGIGLALTHRIVEDVHGGHLRFEPIEGGARFVVDLPAEGAGT